MSHPPASSSKTIPSPETSPSQRKEAHHNAFLNETEIFLTRIKDKDTLDYGGDKDRVRAANREQQGEVVSLKPDGTPHNHVKKVNHYQGGLKNRIARLQDLLGDSSASHQQKMHAQRLLSKASKFLDQTERYIKSEPKRTLSYAARQVARFGKMSAIAALLFGNSLFGKTPAEKQFRQTLQQTHLTESYNGSHPNRPVAARGKASGQIGGVGHKLGMIQGLFDHPEALFEKEHYFMVPMEGEKVPFSERELKLILRELAIGIYAHEAVPFFSLELRAHHKIPRQCFAPSNAAISALLSFESPQGAFCIECLELAAS